MLLLCLHWAQRVYRLSRWWSREEEYRLKKKLHSRRPMWETALSLVETGRQWKSAGFRDNKRSTRRKGKRIDTCLATRSKAQPAKALSPSLYSSSSSFAFFFLLPPLLAAIDIRRLQGRMTAKQKKKSEEKKIPLIIILLSAAFFRGRCPHDGWTGKENEKPDDRRRKEDDIPQRERKKKGKCASRKLSRCYLSFRKRNHPRCIGKSNERAQDTNSRKRNSANCRI